MDSLYCAPSMLSMLLQEEQLLKKTNLLSVNLIICASSDISQHLVDNIYKYFTRAELRNTYGSTEVGGGILFGPHPMGLPTPRGSVGYPNKNFQCRLVDGILEIKGPLLAKGYTTKKELFKKDGFFSTNDLFEVDNNGFYYFLGRADNMFKCGGYSIYPESIESMLEKHPAVISAAVIGVPDEVKGHKPYAFVLRSADITETELKEYALKNGPSYQHPRRIWFVDVMPLNGTNKIDKKELMKRAITQLNLPH